ncbi:MAG: hypothetical protein NT027_05865 [Proteobacteria bacterium]|nr:hypothetical protein [Pseudomonadota bacterium]
MQHRPSGEPIGQSLPIVIQPIFSECVPNDGAAQFYGNFDGKIISSLDLVWNTPAKDHWDLQLNTPAGDSRLELQRRGTSIGIQGDITPAMRINESGILNIEGYDLPIFADELPCILAGQWPHTWTKILFRPARSKKSSTLKFYGFDKFRDIHLDIDLTDIKVIKSCTKFEWGGFWGFFKKSAQVCVKKGQGQYSVDIVAFDVYQVKWWTDVF